MGTTQRHVDRTGKQKVETDDEESVSTRHSERSTGKKAGDLILGMRRSARSRAKKEDTIRKQDPDNISTRNAGESVSVGTRSSARSRTKKEMTARAEDSRSVS